MKLKNVVFSLNKKYIIAVVIVTLAIYGIFWFGKRSAIAPEKQESVPNGMQREPVAVGIVTVSVGSF